MKHRTVRPVAFLWALALAGLPLAAPAQDEAAAADSGKSKSELRKEAYAAEEEFYAIFNDLNDEKDFTVRCYEESPTGTNIKNHVCRARFVTKAYDRHARRNRADVTRIANQSADPAFEKRMAEYQAHMETLIAENPPLQEALVRYNMLLDQLAAMEN